MNRFEFNDDQNPASRSYQADGSLAGRFLVATPQLFGTPFAKSVVLVLQHNEQGTFGAVLNRPGGPDLIQAWDKMSSVNIGADHLLAGGPIGGPVIAIHLEPEVGELEMPNGVFVSTEKEAIEHLSLLQSNDPRSAQFKIVFGVAGWKLGQLESEIDNGSWFTLGASAAQVFDDPNWMWEDSVRRYGQQVFCDLLGVDEILGDPHLN
jgi:putative transcriptional regulator